MLDEKEIDILRKRDFFSKEDNFKKYKDVKSKLVFGEVTEKEPFITLMIPTFKREYTLKETITSILKQKNFDDYEILVVDNDDTFNEITKTEEVIREFNSSKILYYKNEKNIGMYANWNRCLELARSKWVCMVHDDDAVAENYLETMTKIIKNNKKINYLGCRHHCVFQKGDPEFKINDFTSKVECNEKNIIFSNYKDYNYDFNTLFLGAIFDREKAIEIGGFNISSSYIEDYFFVSKFAYYFNTYRLNCELYVYRWANNQSMKTEIWENEAVYEYYLYKYISNKRFILIRPFYSLLSKNYIIRKLNTYLDGSSFLAVKCNINKENVFKMCDFNKPNINIFILLVAKFIKKILEKSRRYFNSKVYNINLQI
ncbi:glycosyltransferase family 2 protein [uncultured Clostridium sp.]|uniref:glycosyltransferase family 2 protein n=1 Tax=uncultured Clostridium sp. TaxID=59620 RepID=UPI0025DB199F|nr:glycosyltransferase family 2 protein [uncultured Clostridium sp.]